jgi:hypothetical protein
MNSKELYNGKNIFFSLYKIFGIVVVVQSTFRLEIHQNDVFLFLKNYF